MIRIPNIALNITTGLFAGVGAYTGNYWYLCGSAVCMQSTTIINGKIKRIMENKPKKMAN